jgi:hypothetical protein
MDFRESLFLAALLLVIVMAPAILHRGPGLMEVASEHDTFFEGVLDGPLVIGARLFEHLIERADPSRWFPRVHVLGRRFTSTVSRFARDLFLAFFFVPRWADTSGASVFGST